MHGCRWGPSGHGDDIGRCGPCWTVSLGRCAEQEEASRGLKAGRRGKAQFAKNDRFLKKFVSHEWVGGKLRSFRRAGRALPRREGTSPGSLV